MLTVTTPATDRTLLTLAELRGAVGVTDTDSDGKLQTIGDRVSDLIANHCKIAGDGINPATLRKETVRDVFRIHGNRQDLILSRRHVVSIDSIVEGTTTLTSSDYEFHAGAGLVTRLCGDRVTCWHCGKITVNYQAGFTKVPNDLKMAAVKLVRLYWSEDGRDPLVRQEEIPDVLKTTYWVGSLGSGALPPDIDELLQPYMNTVA